MKFVMCVVSALILALFTIAIAGGPGMMSYQGELKDGLGNPVPDGNYDVIFSIYGLSIGGTALWAETTTVTATDGLFSKTLGSGHSVLNYLIFEDNSTYMGIKVGTNSEMTPRTRLVSVPYALQSNRADTASVSLSGPVGDGGWSDNGSTVTLTTSTDRVLINSTSSSGKLAVYSSGTAIIGECTALMGSSIYGKAYGGFGQGLRGYATGSSGNGVFGIADSSATIGVYGLAKLLTNGKGVQGVSEGGGDGVYGEAQGSGRGVVAYNSGTGMGLVATSDQSIGVFATSNEPVEGMGIFGMASGSHATGIKGYSSGTYATGVHGQAASQDGIGVYGQADSADGIGVKGSSAGLRGKGLSGTATGPSGIGIYGENTANNGVAIKGVATNASAGTGVQGEGAAYGMYAHGTSDNATGIRAVGGPNGKAAILVGNLLMYGVTSGDVVMELGEGLDYAEAFDISEGAEISPGTVVAIDSKNPGNLTVCQNAYDKKVAGIIAGANGLGSGVRLGTGQYDKDVALAGRVYCQVEALDETIEPGDLLTTSSTPGYAMKATDHIKAQGAILGKAMEPLAKGQKGMILVLVTLQ